MTEHDNSGEIVIAEAAGRDAARIAELCAVLWPDASVEEHRAELENMLRSGMCGILPMTVFVARDAGEAIHGFIQVGMRSHADGCDTAQPVGYIEGWFVREPMRRHGIGRALVCAAETWARQHGCREIASDTWIDNEASEHAHVALGFEVTDRCVLFRKSL